MITKSEFTHFKGKLEDRDALLVAVSKMHPGQYIQTLYDWGHRDFGENRVQEVVDKYESLPSDIRWHLIGPLQTNKVKYIVDFIYMIQSVDRIKVAKEIQKRAKRAGRCINILLQVHIAEEEQKHGFSPKEVIKVLPIIREMDHLRVCGLMGMATFTSDEETIRREFNLLSTIFHEIKEEYPALTHFQTLSMGMSSDYNIALAEGSNCVRVGSKIFGPRSTKT